MSNSSLVAYTKLSPNCTKPRNHAIDTITIHCTAGQCTAESLGNIFANPARQASSNYGVDKDGRVGLYVDEANRSWCTSSRDNDMRAITIEVSSDNVEPYKVTDAALKSLVVLVADICKRNGIKKLVWSTNKNDRVNHLNGCNMTVHRDYAAKACPGEYLYGKHGWIAFEVNKLLGAEEDKVEARRNVELNTKEIYKFFKDKGLTDEGVSGLMGNLQAESGLRSNNLQNSFETKLGVTDKSYTAAVNRGTCKDMFVYDKAGYGLAQWTFWSRKKALYEYAESIGHTIDSTLMQVQFLYIELFNNYKSVFNVLTSSHNLRECSDIVLTQFEKPANQSDAVKQTRYNMSLSIYTKYKTDNNNVSTNREFPFLVKVNRDNLNIREGAGTNYNKKGYIPRGTYTIVEVQNKNWGKLKSGLGWICLDYVETL